jgi:hypothetical protein
MSKCLKITLALLAAVALTIAGAARPLAAQTAAVPDQDDAKKAAAQASKTETAQESEQVKQLKARVAIGMASPAELEALQKAEAYAAANEPVVKTYALKYISASEFMRSAKFYVYDSSGTESTLTVKIPRKNISDFEALLKKLDVEKKNIQFQVYTIVASKEDLPKGYEDFAKNETTEIMDKDLKRVLDEMRGLWNFKHYWIDSPSFLIAKDGSGGNRFKLVNRFDLQLILENIRLRSDEPGKRIISVGQIALTQDLGNKVDNLINTGDITMKEKGYLVVGVSGLAGMRGMALILVVSAEIK